LDRPAQLMRFRRENNRDFMIASPTTAPLVANLAITNVQVMSRINNRARNCGSHDPASSGCPHPSFESAS
jgi:hypothetical protein